MGIGGPGFLAAPHVPHAGKRCLLSLGVHPKCGGPTPPQPGSRVRGEVRTHCQEAAPGHCRLRRKLPAWRSHLACHQAPFLATHDNDGESPAKDNRTQTGRGAAVMSTC